MFVECFYPGHPGHPGQIYFQIYFLPRRWRPAGSELSRRGGANDTLSKYGFAPEVLGTLLGLYRHAVRTIFGDRNEKEYLFFNFNDHDVVVPIKADALGKRVGRRLKALTGGKQPRSQLFRTMLCTWFLNDADPRPNAQERELMAKMMMHSEERQLCNYNKRVTRSQMPAPKRQRALVTEDDVEGGEL